MRRKIVHIEEEKCNGCGACATACHEGAIEIVNGKAKLIKDDYCDGLGDCLPHCPMDAIHIIEREAADYDEVAVKARMEAAQEQPKPFVCPGSMAKAIAHEDAPEVAAATKAASVSRLANWPVQIKLAPPQAPYFDGARLLIAADCTAYAYASFHEEFIKGHVALIGCPKLDAIDYSEKLTEIIKANDIKSVTIVRMEVPCCGGLEYAAKTALQNSGKFLPWQVVTISIDGRILD